MQMMTTIARLTIFASAIRYLYVNKKTGEKGALLFVRDVFSEMYANLTSEKVVLFLDRVLVANEEDASILLGDDLVFSRDILDKALMTSLPMDSTGKLAEMYKVDVDVFQMLKRIHQVETFVNSAHFNFEPHSLSSFDALISMTEMEISFPLTGKFNELSPYMMDTNKSLDLMKEIKETVSLIMNTQDIRKQKENKNDIFDTSEALGTFVSEMKGDVTEKVLKRYLKSRHEIVVRAVQEVLDIPFEESDISMPTRFGYNGFDSHLTPDLAYENECSDTVHLIDVAVTRSRVEDRAEAKESYYSLLAEELSNFLGKDVQSDSVIVSIKSGEEIYLPSYLSEYRSKMEEVQETLMAIEEVMKTKNGYMETTLAMERKEVMEQMMEKNKAMKKLSALILKISSINNLMAADTTESFTKLPSDIFPEFKLNKDDSILQRIKQDYLKFNESEYLYGLLAEVTNQIAKGAQPHNIKKLFSKKDVDKVISENMEIGLKSRKEFNSIAGSKIPKIFKFPDVSVLRGCNIKHTVEGAGFFHSQKDDGTMRYMGRVDMEFEDYVENRPGIGIDAAEDMVVMEEAMDYLTSPSSMEFRNVVRESYQNAPKKMQKMFELKIFEVAYSIKELAENLAYLEGRRFENSSRFTVVKHYEELGYTLSVMKGSRLTTEGQIRYKITSLKEVCGGKVFHTIMDKGDEIGESKWLTVSSTDLQTMVMMFEKCVALASHYLDCLEESRESESYPITPSLKSKVIIVPLMILMEMKRGTSTTCQYNRYILNSMMGYISDQEKAVKDIMQDPVRSRLESYVRLSQMDWASRLSKKSKKIWFENLTKKISTERDYDALYCPAIYSEDEDLEFCVQMNDIYHGNLFQKEAGFISHRSKAIISKTMEAEKEFIEKRDISTLNANLSVEDCFSKKDEKHVYSKEFIMLMGKKVASKVKASPLYEEKILSKLLDNMHDSMMMTYSLKSARIPTSTLEQEREQKTDITFLTMYSLIEEFGTSATVGMISRDNLIEAVFSMFPKAQIGGPREILIQSYRMRLHVKFMENFFEGLCTLHPKEMLTRGLEKENIQSSTASDHKKKCIKAVMKDKMFPLTATLVADASRWAPSFVMHMFMHFLVALELPQELEDHFMCVLRSFSSKVSMMPKALKKKWDKKMMDQEEGDEILEWARKMGSETEHTLRIFSGMGQGMLHRFSSFLHCAKDDVMDDLYRAVESQRDIKIEMVTMISSDDLMKQMFIATRDPLTAFESLHRFMIVYEVTNMLSNIHTNWKKTALSFLIDEFNSYFSTGKRAIMAVIKDVFTAMEVVDLTEPVTAVKTIVGNISRAFRNGLYMDTAEIMFHLMRVFLMRSYAITDSIVENLCDLLSCTANQLPADLGFLSTDHIMGQMIFGPDIMMFREDNSDTLNQFYTKVFTGVRLEANELLKNDYMSAISGRIRITLPHRMDKNLIKLKDRAMTMMSTNMKEIMRLNESLAMFSEEGYNTATNMFSYTRNYFVGTDRKYEFSAPMCIHSMVRALQLQGDKLSTYPEVKEGARYSLMGFTTMILERDSSLSSISMYSPYNAMMEVICKAEIACKSITRSEGRRHNKKVSLRFRTRELVMSADTKEIISFMTGESTKVSNRITRIMEDLCKIFTMDFRKFMDNPVMEILETMSEMEYPATIFRKVVENYVSARVNYSMDIMCSFLDKGNAYDNLVSIYCERKSAAHLYSSKSKGSFTNVAHDINTWMALGGSIETIPWSSIISNMDSNSLLEAENILTADGPLERMAKILYMHKKKFKIPVSDFVFHRCTMLDRFRNMHVYFDFSDLVVIVTNNQSCTHFVNFIGEMLHMRTESPVHRLAKFEMSSTKLNEYSKVYWNGLDYQMAPTNNPGTCGFKVSESTMTNRWQMKLIVKWPVAIEEDSNTFSLNVCSDTYTITNDSLMRMADEALVSDFTHMQMTDSSLVSLQTLMMQNNISSKSVFGKMSVKFSMTNAGVSMSDDLLAFTSNMETHNYMELFEGVDLQTMFSTFLTEVTEAAEESEEELLELGLLDDEMAMKLREMMDKESQTAIYQTPAWERKSVNAIVGEVVMKFQEEEMSISYNRISKIFKNVHTQVDADKVWSILATEIMMGFQFLEEFMARIVLVSVYKSLNRRFKVVPPKNVCLIEDYRMTAAPLITSVSVDDYQVMMSMLSED